MHPNKVMDLQPADHFRERAIARGEKFLCPHCRKDITRDPFLQHLHISAVLNLPDVTEVYYAEGIYTHNPDNTRAIFRGFGSPFGSVVSIAKRPPAKVTSLPAKVTSLPAKVTSKIQSIFAPSKRDANGVSTLSLQVPERMVTSTKRKGGTWKPDKEADLKKIRSDENAIQKMIYKQKKAEEKQENQTASELVRFWETTMDRFQDKFGHLDEGVE
jgi:hypothetical protein